ncbi:PIN domain-containing protein [Streptomyces sp. NPDC059454]|uniref:PIN domain-containing protein n=1 Tax=Streptomyces sp. NPDC059454 TaxID=3346836 RepID=UPI0036CB8D76
MIYLDTSAPVTWMTRRGHRGAPDAFLQERATEPLATGTLGFVETVRTLDLMGHFPKAMEDLDARITEILLTREVRDAAGLLVGRLRTSDAIHVASALSLRDDLTAVVTYDGRMLGTARAEGLSAHAPGMVDRPGHEL